ncbi:MAG: heme NO-binding domain-containing protein [Gemmatimonadetes bacterium]|nr:heme NO-binding domain-containing protein [Gemmatimonadota bacterium]
MHGIIFSELRKYVDTTLGSGAWTATLADAGLGNKLYLPIQDYPDSDVFALVSSASRTTGLEIPAILEDFGQFIAPALLGLYRTLVQPEWKTLDLLENTEQTIHSVVRARNPGAKPAELTAVRVAPDLVDLTYFSQRKLCPVAKGIVRGIAKHYGEAVTIDEVECMHTGADACRMEVRVAA